MKEKGLTNVVRCVKSVECKICVRCVNNGWLLVENVYWEMLIWCVKKCIKRCIKGLTMYCCWVQIIVDNSWENSWKSIYKGIKKGWHNK